MFKTIRSSMFKEEKVAQMAAYFLSQQDKPMPVLKLMKLLYLSDRQSMQKSGFPITFDRMVSMPHGPVLSETLGFINGTLGPESAWESWISDRANHEVSLKRHFNEVSELGSLSQADVEIMSKVWAEFKHMNQFEISDYTHDHCNEWKDPDGSSYPISYKDVFIALGKSEVDSAECDAEIEHQKELENLFS